MLAKVHMGVDFLGTLPTEKLISLGFLRVPLLRFKREPKRKPATCMGSPKKDTLVWDPCQCSSKCPYLETHRMLAMVHRVCFFLRVPVYPVSSFGFSWEGQTKLRRNTTILQGSPNKKRAYVDWPFGFIKRSLLG